MESHTEINKPMYFGYFIPTRNARMFGVVTYSRLSALGWIAKGAYIVTAPRHVYFKEIKTGALWITL